MSKRCFTLSLNASASAEAASQREANLPTFLFSSSPNRWVRVADYENDSDCFRTDDSSNQ